MQGPARTSQVCQAVGPMILLTLTRNLDAQTQGGLSGALRKGKSEL